MQKKIAKEDEINKEITLKKIENELKKNLLQFEKDLRISDTINFDDIPKMTN